MKFYSQKIAAIGLIAVLVSLAGWFCVNPQGMQMSDDSLAEMSARHDSQSRFSALNACAVNDCLSKLPQVVVIKKFSVDFDAGFLVSIFDNQTPRLLADFSGTSDFSKTHPPVPDTLSSVFKKE